MEPPSAGRSPALQGGHERRHAPPLGIHGCGRIGRAVFRQYVDDYCGRVAVVNDAHAGGENLAYLLRHDSIYGRWPRAEKAVPFVPGPAYRSRQHIDEVDWADVRVVVDCSGGSPESARYRRLLERGVDRVVVTQPTSADVAPMVISRDDLRSLGRESSRILSTGTCDSVAIAPVLRRLDGALGLRSAGVVTLHPALSYQNVLDNPLSASAPRAHADAFGLGRAAGLNVIPKETNLVDVLREVDPGLARKVTALSFRVPTHTVTCAVLDLVTERRPSLERVTELLRDWPYEDAFVRWSTEQLVSSDLSGSTCAATVDGRFLAVRGNALRLLLWYDNEWGYAAHVLRVLRTVPAGAPT